MISPGYLEVLKKSREELFPYWGGGGARHVPVVVAALEELGIMRGEILDYGSGVGTFGDAMRSIAAGRYYSVTNYEPTLPQWRELPAGQFDAVVCTHVLEHIEPELLVATLEEIRARAKHLVYLEVPFGPAKETLADGRNAHLIQEPLEFWCATLGAVFGGAWSTTVRLNTIGSQATLWLRAIPERAASP